MNLNINVSLAFCFVSLCQLPYEDAVGFELPEGTVARVGSVVVCFMFGAGWLCWVFVRGFIYRCGRDGLLVMWNKRDRCHVRNLKLAIFVGRLSESSDGGPKRKRRMMMV